MGKTTKVSAMKIGSVRNSANTTEKTAAGRRTKFCVSVIDALAIDAVRLATL